MMFPTFSKCQTHKKSVNKIEQISNKEVAVNHKTKDSTKLSKEINELKSKILILEKENSDINGIKLEIENLKVEKEALILDLENLRRYNSTLVEKVERQPNQTELISEKNKILGDLQSKLMNYEFKVALLEKEKNDMKQNIELKDDYIKTLQNQNQNINNVILENKKLSLEKEELELTLSNKIKECIGCKQYKESVLSLKNANKTYRNELSTVTEEKMKLEKELIEIDISKSKVENENDKLRKHLDKYNSVEPEKVDELVRTVSTLKSLVVMETEQKKRTITKTCDICQQTAKLIFECFKSELKYKPASQLSQKLFDEFKKVKITLLRHIQCLLITNMVDSNGQSGLMNCINKLVEECDKNQTMKSENNEESDRDKSPSFVSSSSESLSHCPASEFKVKQISQSNKSNCKSSKKPLVTEKNVKNSSKSNKNNSKIKVDKMDSKVNIVSPKTSKSLKKSTSVNSFCEETNIATTSTIKNGSRFLRSNSRLAHQFTVKENKSKLCRLDNGPLESKNVRSENKIQKSIAEWLKNAQGHVNLDLKENRFEHKEIIENAVVPVMSTNTTEFQYSPIKYGDAESKNRSFQRSLLSNPDESNDEENESSDILKQQRKKTKTKTVTRNKNLRKVEEKVESTRNSIQKSTIKKSNSRKGEIVSEEDLITSHDYSLMPMIEIDDLKNNHVINNDPNTGNQSFQNLVQSDSGNLLKYEIVEKSNEGSERRRSKRLAAAINQSIEKKEFQNVSDYLDKGRQSSPLESVKKSIRKVDYPFLQRGEEMLRETCCSTENDDDDGACTKPQKKIVSIKRTSINSSLSNDEKKNQSNQSNNEKSIKLFNESSLLTSSLSYHQSNDSTIITNPNGQEEKGGLLSSSEIMEFCQSSNEVKNRRRSNLKRKLADCESKDIKSKRKKISSHEEDGCKSTKDLNEQESVDIEINNSNYEVIELTPLYRSTKFGGQGYFIDSVKDKIVETTNPSVDYYYNESSSIIQPSTIDVENNINSNSFDEEINNKDNNNQISLINCSIVSKESQKLSKFHDSNPIGSVDNFNKKDHQMTNCSKDKNSPHKLDCSDHPDFVKKENVPLNKSPIPSTSSTMVGFLGKENFCVSSDNDVDHVRSVAMANRSTNSFLDNSIRSVDFNIDVEMVVNKLGEAINRVNKKAMMANRKSQLIVLDKGKRKVKLDSDSFWGHSTPMLALPPPPSSSPVADKRIVEIDTQKKLKESMNDLSFPMTLTNQNHDCQSEQKQEDEVVAQCEPEPNDEENKESNLLAKTGKGSHDESIAFVFSSLVNKPQNEFNRLLSTVVVITEEIEARAFVDAIFHFFSCHKHKAYETKHVIDIICYLVMSIIRQCQKVYTYYHKALLNTIRTFDWETVTTLIVANLSFYVTVQQWDYLIGFFLDLIRIPNVTMLKLVTVIKPDTVFPTIVREKYSTILELIKRIVRYEFHLSDLSLSQIEDVQRFWLLDDKDEMRNIEERQVNGSTLKKDQDKVTDIGSIIDFSKKLIIECKKIHPLLKISKLDRDIRKKYVK